jgi:hypothetical protein
MMMMMNTDLESGAEDSDFKNEFEDCEDEERPSAQQDEAQAATCSGASPTWGPPQGRNINIHPFVGPAKGLKNSEAPHINKDSSPLSVLMLFFTQIFQLLVEQTNLYYQQHLYRQAGPSRRLPDIMLPDMMTFTALALQMGHDLKDTLHDYWSRLKTATHSRFTVRP